MTSKRTGSKVLAAELRERAMRPGRGLQALVMAWRSEFSVFFEDRRVPATSNASEREVRHSVV
jgi:hypothetical protein